MPGLQRLRLSSRQPRTGIEFAAQTTHYKRSIDDCRMAAHHESSVSQKPVCIRRTLVLFCSLVNGLSGEPNSLEQLEAGISCIQLL